MTSHPHLAPPLGTALHAESASLDPEDWDEFRRLGHRMLDDMIDWLRTVGDRPVWQPPPATALAVVAPLPRDGTGAAAAYEAFRRSILPYGMGNVHPRYWGWVTGTGTPVGMLADMLVGAMNNHVAFGNHAATHLERQVIAWSAQLLGLPAATSGILVSSGSAANLTGLTVARDAMLPDVLARGGRALSKTAVVYASTETHNSVDKALGILGLGRENLRKIPADADYRIDVRELERAIAADRDAGNQPICVVGTAGTVGTGAVDDLAALAEIAAREKLWLHVDAAFGAALAASPRLRGLLTGIERADSVAFDFHKWFHVQYDAGCVLVRDASLHRRSFAPPAAYLAPMERGVTGGGTHFGELGVDLSRGFRALKVWLPLMANGIDRYGEQVEKNVAQARYLAGLIDREPSLELAAPVATNIVTFRYVVAGASLDELNALNREILMQLHESGVAVPSYTVLQGRFVIRCAIANHRSRRSDFDVLVRRVVELGDQAS